MSMGSPNGAKRSSSERQTTVTYQSLSMAAGVEAEFHLGQSFIGTQSVIALTVEYWRLRILMEAVWAMHLHVLRGFGITAVIHFLHAFAFELCVEVLLT